MPCSHGLVRLSIQQRSGARTGSCVAVQEGIFVADEPEVRSEPLAAAQLD
jgi:hypothetical protein